MAHFSIIECRGSPYTMGKMQGEKLKESIHSTINDFENFEEYKCTAGKYITAKNLFSITGSGLGVASFINRNPTIREWNERVEGLAGGCGISSKIMKGLQVIETVLSFPWGLNQCTTIAIAPDRSKDGTPILLKNYDISLNFDRTTFLRRSFPRNGNSSIEMAINVMAGSHLAMNEKGLCISYNYGMVRCYPGFGVFPTYLVQYAIEKFSEASSAVEWLVHQRSTNGCIITVMDKSGEIYVIEKAKGKSGIRRPDDGIAIVTNHFLCDSMKSMNYDIKTCFGKNSPPSLRGESIQETNVRRMERAKKLTGGQEKISIDFLKKIAADHEEKEKGDGNTICRHHSAMNTIASAILLPVEQIFMFCPTNPCKGEFAEISAIS